MVLCCLAMAVWSCQNAEEQQKQQYISMGRLVYQKQCINCHQEDGKGLGTLFPDLTQSQRLKTGSNELFCLIKYGSPPQVKGEEYRMKMLAFDHLKEDELAKVMTYISHAYGDGESTYSDQDALEALKDCATNK